MGNCNVTGPNQVMVVNGGPCINSKKIRVGAVGGCAWSWWFCSHVTKLPLNIITLKPTCTDVETKQGVALTVTGVAQVMIDTSVDLGGENSVSRQPKAEKSLMRALEQFSGQPRSKMEDTILQTLEGHLRAILGSMTVEQIYTEREAFSARVRQTATADLERMGLKIVSFVIRDVTDKVDYLNSKGLAEIANAEKFAAIGKAEAERDASVAQAECNAARETEEIQAKTAIANSERDYKTQKSLFDQESNTKAAEAALAYSLQAAKVHQRIRSEQVEINVVETKKQIEIEEQEVLRKEKELIATVNRPAEAERYRLEAIAEGKRTEYVSRAKAEAEATKLIGIAHAKRTLAVGEAEAEAMKVKADAYKTYGEAAKMKMIIDVLPEITKHVSGPLKNIGDIVLLNGNNDHVTGEVSKLMAMLPPVVSAVSGVDIKEMLRKGRLADASTV